MELNLLYVHGPEIGYGRYGTFLAQELEKMAVDVYDDLPIADEIMLSDSDEKVNAGRRTGIANTVCWISVPTHARGWWQGQRPVISTMWEANRLPPSFRENLHEFAQVIVPSRQNVELFSQYHDNVAYVPLGIDPDRWHYTQRKPASIFFDFLIGGSGPRKGTMLAHDAFVKVFGDDHWEHGTGLIPRLIMKSPKGQEPIDHPRVLMRTGRLTADEEVALYEDAHCYLQPSRGEGFGLQPLQAIAQGIPTILTDAHGHEAFAGLGLPIGSSMVPADYFIYGDAGEWWEPDFDELCDRMRWVYDNYAEALAAAETSAAVVAEQFTWRRCAENFVAAIGEEHLTPYAGSGDWYVPTAHLFEVVLNRDWIADIAGRTYQFTKGVSYYEPADVKRIMFDADLLDPVCLQGEDSGLHPRQLAEVPDYSASHSHCSHCGQRLGSQPTYADDLFADAERGLRVVS